MPKYMPKGCKCASKKRYVSSGIANYPDCIDVCTAPICGTADNLTLLAPVVYDEIGINLCREVPLTAVSYTHLDVYKRQVNSIKASEMRGVHAIPLWGLISKGILVSTSSNVF